MTTLVKLDLKNQDLLQNYYFDKRLYSNYSLIIQNDNLFMLKLCLYVRLNDSTPVLNLLTNLIL